MIGTGVGSSDRVVLRPHCAPLVLSVMADHSVVLIPCPASGPAPTSAEWRVVDVATLFPIVGISESDADGTRSPLPVAAAARAQARPSKPKVETGHVRAPYVYDAAAGRWQASPVTDPLARDVVLPVSSNATHRRALFARGDADDTEDGKDHQHPAGEAMSVEAAAPTQPVLSASPAAAAALADCAPLTLSLLTYNVWFSEWQRDVRIRATLELLAGSGADVIALQEVLPQFLTAILLQQWVRDNYALSDILPENLEPYGVVLLVRITRADLPRVSRFRHYPLPSQMSRSLLVAEFDAVSLRVATVHFESLNQFAAQRHTQLTLATSWLTSAGATDRAGVSFLMGDFNFDPSYRENAALAEQGWVDAWPVIHPDEEGCTMADAWRPDRIVWTASAGAAKVTPVAVHRIGDRPIPEVVMAQQALQAAQSHHSMAMAGDCMVNTPSDHLGLVGVFLVRQ
jgi:endonuclease/exonuclease/phosphatase family metal-dependent hydrolase